ncbi:MAG: SCO family protein [Nocardioidaceae bacterium]
MTLRIPPSRQLAVAALAAALALGAGCGDSSSDGAASTSHDRAATMRESSTPAKTTATSPKTEFAGGVVTPPFPARPLELRNYDGRRVNLADYKGKAAVLVTFIYTNCPDICPLIVGNLRTAQAMLGRRARKLRIVAVSADPRGDDPRSVAAFLRQHEMTGRMDYLIGSRRQLGRVWKEWGIVAKPDKAHPDLVEHSAQIYGIGASGKVLTLYPANFKPADIAHDAPRLAAS